MNLFANYNKERLGWNTIEIEDQGFISYSVNGKTVVIQEVYVVPHLRLSGVGKRLAAEVLAIAKSMGCNEMLTQVPIHPNGADTSLKTALAYGFKMISANNDCIILSKYIGG